AEALVRHILNWGPEEKAPPKRGLKCTGITPLRGRRASAAGQFATWAKDSHAWGYTKGHSIQTPPVHIRGPTRSKLGLEARTREHARASMGPARRGVVAPRPRGARHPVFLRRQYRMPRLILA